MLKFLKKLFTIKSFCPVCGRLFNTKRGVNIHIGKQNDAKHINYRFKKIHG